jgi:hypothetical protein
LIQLVSSYEEAQTQLDKENNHEHICRIAGIVGLIVFVAWVFEPLETTAFVGELGLTIAFIAILFGIWAWFWPPSKNPERVEAYKKREIFKKLEELGFEPIVLNGCVFVKETGKEIDPRNSDNFSIKVQNDIPF